ncbi:uncharacterized protein LOC122963885 [Acropora millepora]|uniref:uncharacterized protein LOC122963885 n=1 Tax=Acropora millepora TaxID=45264 RepID=UPI001CF42C2E|nr:uncharacterized protein LOC122963885 [Acropora millepora]
MISLLEVLKRLQKYNVRLNLRKSVFLKKQVVYLGLRVDSDGLKPVQEKIDAIKNAPAPEDVGELRSFLGMAILGPKSAVPALAAARMQRWALILSAYDYDLMYRRSEEHSNSDGLSRLPCQESRVAMEGEVYAVGAVRENFRIMAAYIAEATIKDPLLCKVYQYTLNGWPDRCDDMEIKPFHNRRYELSCEQGCVLWVINCTGSPESSVAE